jgi:DNA-binding MurR/RpiR family transcriptional regulator
MKLTPQQRKILEKFSVGGLRFLAKIAEDKDFESLRAVVDYLIDVEKNVVFGLPEDKLLATEHAYSRGKVGGLIEALTLIMSARGELERREQKRKEAHGKT